MDLRNQLFVIFHRMEKTHWLLRVGDGEHFWSSSPRKIWGIDSTNRTNTQSFINSVQPGDFLWFVKSGERGKIIAVSTFTSLKKRETGPLISFNATNEELGWVKQNGNWDTEVHYVEMYDLRNCNVFSEIKSPRVIRKFNIKKCSVDLPTEYPYIVKYSKAILM